jgi:hypothetical protein
MLLLIMNNLGGAFGIAAPIRSRAPHGGSYERPMRMALINAKAQLREVLGRQE